MAFRELTNISETILVKTCEYVLENSITDFTPMKISSVIGASEYTIYRYFKNKDNLLKEAFLFSARKMINGLFRIMAIRGLNLIMFSKNVLDFLTENALYSNFITAYSGSGNYKSSIGQQFVFDYCVVFLKGSLFGKKYSVNELSVILELYFYRLFSFNDALYFQRIPKNESTMSYFEGLVKPLYEYIYKGGDND